MDYLLDIGELAGITGVAPSALRYYERVGLLEPAGRHGIRRTYRPDAVDRVALIRSAQVTGFSLAEVRELVQGEPQLIRSRLTHKIMEIDRHIAELMSARDRLGHALNCEHPALLDCPTFRAGLREVLPGSHGNTISG
ncbi:MerR family transcriptional regulator [Actinoplanes sp. NPDC051859]|uniref:MerR family transcriptional regulator n=1 Tax=Actinoplanes sp. NPDC051859 TaxID=3363909 RepID=UPI00379591B8